MKKFTKIICTILLVSVLLTGALVAVLADGEYDGVVADAQALLDNVGVAADLTAKRTAMGELDAYMAGHTFDTEAEDYATFYAAYQEAEKNLRIEETTALLGTAESAQDADKKAAYQALYDALAARPLTDEELGEAELLDRVNAAEVAYINILIAEIEADKTVLASYGAFYTVFEARPLTDEEVENAGLTDKFAAIDKDYLLLLVAHAKADGATLAACQAYYAEVTKHQYDEAALTALGVTAQDIAAVEKNYITALINEADSKEEYDDLFALTADLAPEVIEENGWSAGLAAAEIGYIGALCDEAKAEATIEAYEAVFDRIEDKGITEAQLTEKELLTKVNAAEISYAALLLERVDVEEHGTARNGVYLNLFNYAHRGLDTEHADYAAYKAFYDETYEVKAKAQANAMAQARAALDSENVYSDYENKVLGNFDYDNNEGFGVTSGKVILGYSGGDESPYHPSLAEMAEKGHTYKFIEGADGNKYLSMLYRTIKEPEHALFGAGYNMYTETNLATAGAGNSIVLEFDIKTDSVLPQAGKYYNGGELNGGINIFMKTPSGNFNVLIINPDGTLSLGNNMKLEGAITSGGWTHFSIVFDADNFEAKVYVNYEFFGSKDILENSATYDFSKSSIRIDSYSSDGDYAIDNYQLYVGDKIRIIDKYENLTNRESFILFADALTEESLPLLDRYDVYKTMTDLIKTLDAEGTDWTADTELQAARDKYNKFDLDAALAAVKDNNLAEFRKLVEDFVALGRKLDNSAARKKKADEIQGIVHYYGDNIDRQNPEYIALEATYQQWKADAVADATTATFTAQMQKFLNSNKVSVKQRAYDDAAALFDMLDTTTLDMPTFETFREAYDAFIGADEIIAELTREDNSKTIVGCAEMLSAYSNEIEWEANADTIKIYLNVTSNILKKDTEDNPSYDREYPGIEEALAIYGEIYEYFYNKMQVEHVAKLTGHLNDLKLAESYIDKLAFVSAFEGYLALNDIDYDNERIIDVIAKYEAEKVKVEEDEAEYSAVLIANTQKFKEAIAKMEAADNYLDKKAYYDEATEYYYVMTPGNSEEEITKYDNCLVYLQEVEANSALFVGYVERLGFVENNDDMFAILVECYRYASMAETTLDGVAEALVTYNTLYASYVDSVENIKSEIDMTQFLTGSSRANCGIDSAVNVMFSLCVK